MEWLNGDEQKIESLSAMPNQRPEAVIAAISQLEKAIEYAAGLNYGCFEEVQTLIKHIATLEADNARKTEALEDMRDWSEAYPADIFKEPDWKKAHELLQAGGMTLDGISGSLLRKFTADMGNRAHAALAKEGE